MRQVNWSLHRGRLLCLFLGVALLLPAVFSIGPPTAVATEHDENVTENESNVRVYRASNASFVSAETIEVAIANGTLEPADEVAVGDALVVAIPSERLADTMNATNGSTASPNGSTTARFFAALDGDAQFRIIQTNPTTMRSRVIALLGRENVTVHRDGTTYAVVETGNLTFKYRGINRTRKILGGERFAIQFGYDLPHDWSRGTVPSSPIVELYPPSEMPTVQPETTATETSSGSTTTPTDSESETATTSTRTSTVTSTTESSTTHGQANTTGAGGEQTAGGNQSETPGIPGFTVLTTLVALLVIAVLSTRRS